MPDTYAGTWWIADHRPEGDVRRIEGTLTVDDAGRADLVTSGFWPLVLERRDGRLRATSQSASALVVHGRVAGGQPMTLLRVMGNTTHLRAGAVIEGIWLAPGRPDDMDAASAVESDRRSELVPAEEVAAFASIDVEIEHLSEWAASPTTRMIPLRSLKNEQALLTWSPTADPTAVLPDGTMVTLHSRVHQQQHRSAGQTTIEVADSTIARITPAGAASVNTLLNHIATLRRLIGLAVRREVGVLSTALRPAVPAPAEVLNDIHADDPLPILPLRKLYLPVGHHDAPAIPRHRMLFTQTDIPLAEVLPRWIELSTELRGVVASLVAAHDRDALLEPRLVAAITAAENLSSRTRQGQAPRPVPDEAFARLRQILVDAIAEHTDLQQYEGFVKSKLQNQANLRQRLPLLVDDLGDHAGPLFTGDHTPNAEQTDPTARSETPEVRAWVRAAVKGRNDIAHTGQAADLDTDAMLTVLDTTTVLVELLLLRRLGLPENRLADLVRDHHHNLARRIRRHLLPLASKQR